MTFEEAMAKSRELETAVWLAIGLRKPLAERRAAMSAYIDFNPYSYADGASKCATTSGLTSATGAGA